MKGVADYSSPYLYVVVDPDVSFNQRPWKVGGSALFM